MARGGRVPVRGAMLATLVIVAALTGATPVAASVPTRHTTPTTHSRNRRRRGTSTPTSTTTTLSAAGVEQAYCDANRSGTLDDGELLDHPGNVLVGRLETAASYGEQDPTLSADFAAAATAAKARVADAGLSGLPADVRADVTTIRNARVDMLEQGATLASRPVTDGDNYRAIGVYLDSALSPAPAVHGALDRVTDFLSAKCGL